MEAQLVEAIPQGEHWQYEPKWDGFRCIAFKDGKQVELQSKSGQPLARYFPELVTALAELAASRFMLDGEIVVPVDGTLSFDELLMRIHPAESRIRKLSALHPATYVMFDLLVDDRGKSLIELPLNQRRQRLEAFAQEYFAGALAAAAHHPVAQIRLSPATTSLDQAKRWLSSAGGDLDGVIAKRQDLPYQSGLRTGMVKIKNMRTAECVVAGYRYGSKDTKTLGSLLLGLYDDGGLLHHVGFCSALSAQERAQLTPKIEKLRLPVAKGGGFTGRAPGGPSRWSTQRSGEWESLKPVLVVEVQYDHFSGGRFRHGTKFLRWRPDKLPHKCTLDQVERSGASLHLLQPLGAAKRAKTRRAVAKKH